ncbi:MAG: serine/threonine protein kinase, partial [Chloroflexales bacterium]|nr:serine/threonine protein kinase [Chloroflexales bacterium]
MGSNIVFIGMLLGVAGGLIAGSLAAFNYSLKALPPSGSGGEFATTRRFLALNMCEPPINFFVVPILGAMTNSGRWGHDLLLVGLHFTWPMAVLLIPALGLFFRDSLYRKLSLKILLLGLGRWGINFLIFGLMSGTPSVSFFLILIGCGLFAYSIRWGHNQLNGLLEYPPLAPRIAMPLVVQPVIAARVAQPAPPIVVYPPDPGVRCPVCHAPSSLHDAMCAACGLMLISRVPAPLRQLEGYSVLRPLEIGGMSHIYLARAHADGQLYAIKALAAVDNAVGAEALVCLQREAALLLRLDHPRVVRALEWREGDAPCLVMPYVPGPTLESCSLPLPVGTAVRYAVSVADVLCYLHALPEPVAHCDIKPSNLIVPPDEQPLLVDFGSAALLGANGVQAAPARYGTPGYAAPEQYRGCP